MQKTATGHAAVNLDDLWKRYRCYGDQEAREQLILHYAPLVKRVVSRMGVSESAPLDFQDRISHGMLGLIEAVDRFDPQRGVAFETFAANRIRGAILDALRSLDHVSRSVRRRAGEIERAFAELRGRLGRVPSDEEVADHLGITLESYHKVLDQANIIFLSLDSPVSDLRGGEDMILGEAVEDPAGYDVAAAIEERDLYSALEAALHELPQREQVILSLYYHEELTVREIGEVLNISTTRVSQLLGRAIMALRARLIYDHWRTPAKSRLTARQEALATARRP
jgi:RNA polymerase sigma factor for flagellar operon FliA